jgi:hypothetical protein
MKGNNSVEMGWGAPPMKEQHPVLSDLDCTHFDRDNQDLSRLLVRGLVTRSAAASAREKYVRSVGVAIRAAITAKEPKA